MWMNGCVCCGGRWWIAGSRSSKDIEGIDSQAVKGYDDHKFTQ